MSMIAAFREWFSAAFRALLSAPSSTRAIIGDGRAYFALLLRSRNVHIALALTAVFWTAAYFTDFWSLFLAVNFIIIAIEVLIIVAYVPAFLVAIVSNPTLERDQLIMGIYVAWSFDLAQRIWSLVWRYGGQAQWMLTADVLTFLLFGRMLGAMLHVTAPAAVDGKVPAASWIKLGLAFLAGVIVAVLILALTAGQDLVPF